MFLSSTHLLVLSGSCSFHAYSLNRSVVSIIPLLTGVASKCFHFAKFIFYVLHFQSQCYRSWSLSSLVHFVSTGVLACTSCSLQPFSYVFNLQGSSNVPCSSCLTECFQLSASSLFSFVQFVNLSRFFGFTRLSKKQLSFTSSLSFPLSLRCHSRSRDEFLS